MYTGLLLQPTLLIQPWEKDTSIYTGLLFNLCHLIQPGTVWKGHYNKLNLDCSKWALQIY